jgi:hypothetical protein
MLYTENPVKESYSELYDIIKKNSSGATEFERAKIFIATKSAIDTANKNLDIANKNLFVSKINAWLSLVLVIATVASIFMSISLKGTSDHLNKIVSEFNNSPWEYKTSPPPIYNKEPYLKIN